MGFFLGRVVSWEVSLSVVLEIGVLWISQNGDFGLGWETWHLLA